MTLYISVIDDDCLCLLNLVIRTNQRCRKFPVKTECKFGALNWNLPHFYMIITSNNKVGLSDSTLLSYFYFYNRLMRPTIALSE